MLHLSASKILGNFYFFSFLGGRYTGHVEVVLKFDCVIQRNVWRRGFQAV